jgi:hypothetical protein
MVAALAFAPLLAAVLLHGVRAAPGWLGFVAPRHWSATGASGCPCRSSRPSCLLCPSTCLLLVRRVRTAWRRNAAAALLSLGGIAAYFSKAASSTSHVVPRAIADAPHQLATAALRHCSTAQPATSLRGGGPQRRARRASCASPIRSAPRGPREAVTEPGLRQVWFVAGTTCRRSTGTGW